MVLVETTAVDVVVTGLVQGVAFRWHAQREAQRRGVAGWVRNEVDGSVVGHAEGSSAAVEGFVAWCHEGPRWAEVQRVEVRPAAATGAAGFEIRF